MSDQTEAAIITPAAKPSKAFSTEGFIFFFKNSTHPAPRLVPIKGIIIPKVIIIITVSYYEIRKHGVKNIIINQTSSLHFSHFLFSLGEAVNHQGGRFLLVVICGSKPHKYCIFSFLTITQNHQREPSPFGGFGNKKGTSLEVSF